MIYGEIICKDKVAEITSDGIAAAAAVLATHYSRHLRDSPELTDAFWYFFGKLAGQQKMLERMIKAEEIWTEMADRLRERLPCLLYTSPSPRDRTRSRMPSSA